MFTFQMVSFDVTCNKATDKYVLFLYCSVFIVLTQFGRRTCEWFICASLFKGHKKGAPKIEAMKQRCEKVSGKETRKLYYQKKIFADKHQRNSFI